MVKVVVRILEPCTHSPYSLARQLSGTKCGCLLLLFFLKRALLMKGRLLSIISGFVLVLFNLFFKF